MPRKKIKIRRIVTSVLITLIGAGGWWLSEILSVKNLVVEKDKSAVPIFSMKNMTASFINEDGKKKYTLMAKTMHRYSGHRGTQLKNLHLIQHKPGNADIHTKADTGSLSEDQKKLNMKGNVRISSGKAAGSAASTVNTETLEISLE